MKKMTQWAIYDPIHYAYKGRHIKGRMLGNILAGMIVAASLTVGYLTKEMIFDTVICALTFGNFLRNIGIMVMLLKIGDRDYYVYDEDKSCDESTKEKRVGIYDEMIKRGHRITLSAGFFELYFPFLLTIILPNKMSKVMVPLIFIAGITVIKIICNPERNGTGKQIFEVWFKYTYTYIKGKMPKPRVSLLARLFRKDIHIPGIYIYGDDYYKLLIIIRAVLTSAPFYAAGLLLSYQKQFPVKVFDNLRVVIPVLLIGILCNILGDYKVYEAYRQGRGRVTFDFINRIVANYFGIQTWDDVYEQRAREEEERKRKEAEDERLQRERELRFAYEWLGYECRIQREWEEKQRKREEQERKREEEERLKKAQRKLDQGKISEISQEDLNKLMKLEAEKFKTEIREASRLSRISANRRREQK